MFVPVPSGLPKRQTDLTFCPKCQNKFDAALTDDIVAGPFLLVFEDSWKEPVGMGLSRTKRQVCPNRGSIMMQHLNVETYRQPIGNKALVN
jgi:hypothetical protein